MADYKREEDFSILEDEIDDIYKTLPKNFIDSEVKSKRKKKVKKFKHNER